MTYWGNKKYHYILIILIGILLLSLIILFFLIINNDDDSSKDLNTNTTNINLTKNQEAPSIPKELQTIRGIINNYDRETNSLWLKEVSIRNNSLAYPFYEVKNIKVDLSPKTQISLFDSNTKKTTSDLLGDTEAVIHTKDYVSIETEETVAEYIFLIAK